MSEEEWVKGRWVYVGRRISKDAKLDHAFAFEDDLDGNLVLFAKAPSLATIGGIYEIESTDDKARVQSGEYVGHINDQDRINRWRLESQTAVTRKEAQSAARRMASHNTDIGGLTLREIKLMIVNQPRHVARGTLVLVMDYLR